MSFKDLLTINGRQCDTFKETAKERGLLESDNDISESLGEAVLFKMPPALQKRAILASRNEHVNKLNDKLISMFPSESKTFISFDSAEDDTNSYYKLVLKENAPIMMLRNLDPSNGLCNGTRMICKGFDKNVVLAEITSGHCATKCVFLRIQLSPPENEGYPFKFIQKQFPVRLCFAMTINKAKGQTISMLADIDSHTYTSSTNQPPQDYSTHSF
ncbi:uncharacterized protein LOC129892956 [Solanum dulcamara]|uniref:uncharacterized protein LOC129892956 n=1 Tax=Solanum dulcamara TaxID=45834 RepID=UPI002484ED15|nr:uncharacterized protein LOC129892956 [Solanum dulcamara]